MLILPSDQMLTCPLDESHRIRKERMQFHLVKCQKNHTLQRKMKCPWNPLHIIDKFEWENHWRCECENMPAALEFICQTEEPKDVASVPVNTSRSHLPPSEEDWDANPGTVGTYNPFESAAAKMVMRSKVGLSKAQRKKWHQEERKRFQELEAMGPLKLDQRENASREMKKPAEMPDLRQPRRKPAALSVDASMIEELNASRVSEEGDKKSRVKEVVELRKPHAPSPSMLTKKTPLKPNNTNNETFSSVDVESVAKNGVDFRAESSDLHSDVASIISGVSCSSSRRADIETIRNLLEKSFVTDAAAPETDDEITQRLANLESVKKTIEDQQEFLYQNLSKNMPKLVKPNSPRTPGILENRNDQATSNGHVSPIPNLITGAPANKFTNPIAKCAASFSGPKKIANPPATGAGRGTIVDFSAFNKRSPGKENGGGRSSKKYSQYGSTTSIDETDSVFGYD